jgi:hypothetical protein
MARCGKGKFCCLGLDQAFKLDVCQFRGTSCVRCGKQNDNVLLGGTLLGDCVNQADDQRNMDEKRVIRFITPSAFFLASLLFGNWLSEASSSFSDEHVKTIVEATAAALFPLGFIITAVTMIVLRFGARLCNGKYQIHLSEPAWEEIWKKLGVNAEDRTRDNKVYAGLVFDHSILDKEVHAAAVRLWTAFNIASCSGCALVLALFFGHFCLSIKLKCCWVLLTVILIVLLVTVAVQTWKDHMGLIEFEAKRIKAPAVVNGDED